MTAERPLVDREEPLPVERATAAERARQQAAQAMLARRKIPVEAAQKSARVRAPAPELPQADPEVLVEIASPIVVAGLERARGFVPQLDGACYVTVDERLVALGVGISALAHSTPPRRAPASATILR